MWKAFLYLVFAVLLCSKGLAQISPPGMGEVNTAAWFAIGIKQKLNQKETVFSTTYFGFGSISNPDNYNLFQKQAIYVVNEEISHRFKKHWEYSAALSYRWQCKYEKTEPFGLDTPKARQEFRFYSRFSYLNSIKFVDYSFTLRPEIRFFFNPNFSLPEKTTEFRLRFRGKLVFNLNTQKTQKITTTAEILASTNKTNTWNKFKYKESRFCLYYSITLPKPNITFNIGYMLDLIGPKEVKDVHYIAFDIVFKNPFKKRKS